MRALICYFFCFSFFTSLAQAQSLWSRTSDSVSRAREATMTQIDGLMELGQSIPGTLYSALPSDMNNSLKETSSLIQQQMDGLTVWGLIRGSAGQSAYAASRVPGIAWRIVRFSCSDEAKLDKQILCPGISYYRELGNISQKFTTGVPLTDKDITTLVDLTLYLLETQHKVVSKCVTNARINSCFNQGALDAILQAISSRSADSLSSYAQNLVNGQVLLDALKCTWPEAYTRFEAGQVPEACRAP